MVPNALPFITGDNLSPTRLNSSSMIVNSELEFHFFIFSAAALLLLKIYLLTVSGIMDHFGHNNCYFNVTAQ